jgi:2-dehydropantoate 2-reductase
VRELNEIKDVAILGAGALGSVYGVKFHQAPGMHASFVARGERGDRLRREGVVVNGTTYHLPVVHPDAAEDPADLIIVALKDHHLPDALNDLHGLVSNSTTIISVMNGLDSEATLGGVYGMEKLLYTISVGIDATREDNAVTYTTSGKLIFGAADNTTPSPRVRSVQAALDRAALAWETPVDMIRSLWWKFMVNVGVNQASAVMRASYGVFHTSPDAQALMEALMREVIVLAGREGVALVEGDIDAWYDFLNTLSPEGKTSMLQDIEAGRKTEVDIFAGKVVALGAAHGVPTSVNETVLRIIHVLEQNAGA